MQVRIAQYHRAPTEAKQNFIASVMMWEWRAGACGHVNRHMQRAKTPRDSMLMPYVAFGLAREVPSIGVGETMDQQGNGVTASFDTW